MNLHRVRRRPWTCRFGRLGVTVEQITFDTSRVDDVFWACHRPTRTPPLTLTTGAECEECSFWESAPRLKPQC